MSEMSPADEYANKTFSEIRKAYDEGPERPLLTRSDLYKAFEAGRAHSNEQYPELIALVEKLQVVAQAAARVTLSVKFKDNLAIVNYKAINELVEALVALSPSCEECDDFGKNICRKHSPVLNDGK
jgi:hypothetical protein